MFTGIVETTGKLKHIDRDRDNITFTVLSDISNELKVDQSVAHNGVCLTVTEVGTGWHRTTAIAETLKRSNLGDLKKDDLINLERCLRLSDRLDGHLVQGHVDTTATCVRKIEQGGSWVFEFSCSPEHDGLLVQKGSIAINGVSLTLIDPGKGRFKVAIIPYTFEHTNFKQIEEGTRVNIEFDLIGKYILKNMPKLNSAQ